MYIFRRAAARAISAPRQIRPVIRTTSFQSSIPSIARSFHQSRSFLAEEEQKKEAESSPQQDAVSESSGTTSEPLGQSEQQSENQQSVSEQASELADKAKSTVSEAAETVAEKASYIPAQAEESFSNASENVRSAASSARQAADQFNPFQQQPAKSTTLYIGNLFFEVTAPQLESEFAKIGEVSRSRIVTDDRGLSKGFGYIEFATQEDADEAIHALHDKVFQGRRMNVQYHRRRDPNRGGAGGARNALDKAAPKDPSKTLFIGNMSYQMSDKDLNDLFRQIRNVLDVRVAIDRRSGQPRGFAHADFIDVESAKAAKEILEQKSVYGRQLRVDYSGRAEHGQGRGGRDGGDGASRFS